MVFQTKKLQIETLGEYLAEVRQHLGLSLKEVAGKTAIAEKFLKDLEAGLFHKLPPDVYIIGFLNKLSALYNISAAQVITQYQKERGILEKLEETKDKEEKGWRAIYSRLIITPKLLSVIVGLTGVLAIVIYLTASVAAIDKNPALEILEPANGSVIKDGSIKVSGNTDPGATVIINDQEVFVNGEGHFDVTLGAVAGQKVLDIKAKNKFDRETRNQILVVVEPQVDPADQQQADQKAANVDLSLHLKYNKDTERTITLDSGVSQKVKMDKGESEDISAKTSILLETNDAGSIEATLNGQKLGKLGRSNERLSIPFTKESLSFGKDAPNTNQ